MMFYWLHRFDYCFHYLWRTDNVPHKSNHQSSHTDGYRITSSLDLKFTSLCLSPWQAFCPRLTTPPLFLSFGNLRKVDLIMYSTRNFTCGLKFCKMKPVIRVPRKHSLPSRSQDLRFLKIALPLLRAPPRCHNEQALKKCLWLRE